MKCPLFTCRGTFQLVRGVAAVENDRMSLSMCFIR